MTRSTSSSRPITGSIRSARAFSVRSKQKSLSADFSPTNRASQPLHLRLKLSVGSGTESMVSNPVRPIITVQIPPTYSPRVRPDDDP